MGLGYGVVGHGITLCRLPKSRHGRSLILHIASRKIAWQQKEACKR